ncbi:hypothetical protein CNY89_11530, partial [Amaricoccus sp. HAR-UPW-R2A-40]
MTANLFDLLTRSSLDPDKVAIETASGARTTYAGLIAETGRVANVLRDLGVGPGDRVAAQVEKSVAAIVLYLATVRAGGVFLPLNTGYTPAEVEYFLGDAEPAVFVCFRNGYLWSSSPYTNRIISASSGFDGPSNRSVNPNDVRAYAARLQRTTHASAASPGRATEAAG